MEQAVMGNDPGTDFYQEMVEAAPDALLRVSAEGSIVFANNQAEELFGYRRDELLGRHVGMLLPEWFEAQVARTRDDTASGQRILPIGTGLGLSGRHCDGTGFPVEITAAALGDRPRADIVASVRDVSESRRTDSELRDALSLLAATLESTADGILVVTADGKIAGSNERFAALWGIPPELLDSGDDAKLIGFVLDQLSDPGSFMRKVQELYADPDAESLDMLEFHDGRTFERYSRPQRVGDDIVGRVWSFRDVTERRRAEDQAREAIAQQESLGAIVSSSADAIIGLTPDGVITSWNRGAERLYGYGADEVTGRGIQFLIPEHLRRIEDALLADVRERGVARSFEAERVRKDGTTVPVSVTISPIRAEGGGVRGMAKIVRDITGQRRAAAELLAAREAALESSRLKSEFLATMSHEIRTPMNGVIGLTSLLLETPLDETQRRYAEGVRGAGAVLLALINDILDLSKLEAGKVDLDIAAFDPRVLVEEVAGLLSESARVKGLELIAFCRPDVPALLSGDAGRIRQVLLNLASNAVKFTPAGEVSVRVQPVHQHPRRPALRFEVRDTGIGIEPEHHRRLFESFSQADSSTTRRYGGTGLGLAISRRLTEVMGGEIGLTSAPGEGSTFWFVLPLQPATASVGSEEAAVRSPDLLTGVRVLIVDDNATNRLVLETQLRAWNMDPDTIGDARAALDRCRQAVTAGRPFEIVVLDMCMPEMDGLDLARAIRADRVLAPASLIMLTSSPQLDPAELAAAGVREWLMKPVRSSELYDRLLRLRGGAQAAEDLAARRMPETQSQPRKGRILVVEDNEVNQLVAREMVKRLGYLVDVVSDGAEAVSAVAAASYAAVLMDCHMPVVDGFEATRTIRKGEGTGHLPIIAMTASALDEDREKCLAAGMDDYLTKPVDPSALEAALERWVPPAPGGTA
ncbi:PAS domain S-box protein [Pseudarthrobacter sp. RMG13]|uniref:histidine kinase n=1 Tax=Pseudarthrobacter humi TaxID=2952523 RepID=A0ABT1LNP8_9MICC|nr:PAS domain S-box protein [Pseudarthrobacter humi]MCP9000065.1 PAS domain S-box protein [Pseudarthrobacter humi]